MRILALSMISSLKIGKSRQPAVPASTTVVTPDEKVLTIGLSESFGAGVGLEAVGVHVDDAGRDVLAGDVHDLCLRGRRRCPVRPRRSCRR